MCQPLLQKCYVTSHSKPQWYTTVSICLLPMCFHVAGVQPVWVGLQAACWIQISVCVLQPSGTSWYLRRILLTGQRGGTQGASETAPTLKLPFLSDQLTSPWPLKHAPKLSISGLDKECIFAEWWSNLWYKFSLLVSTLGSHYSEVHWGEWRDTQVKPSEE